MAISREEVLQLANLARLELTPSEVHEHQQQLDKVLGYVAQLQEFGAGGVAPSRAAAELRPDVVQPFVEPARLVAAAPEHDEQFVVVPPVFEEPR